MNESDREFVCHTGNLAVELVTRLRAGKLDRETLDLADSVLFCTGSVAGLALRIARQLEDLRREHSEAITAFLSRRGGGCAVCGAAILADTEDWPASLCLAHAPTALLALLDERFAHAIEQIDREPSPLAHVCAAWAMVRATDKRDPASQLRLLAEIVISGAKGGADA